MKVPKIFIGEGASEEKKHVKKEHNNLEDFIIDKKIMGYERLEISNIDDNDFFHVRGIEPELVEKAVFANYINFGPLDYSFIMLVQYKTKEDFTKNLRQIFKKGIMFYENHSKREFIEIFLFKNNIAVYLQGKDDFNKEAANHYRKKGFKQLEYELKGV